MSIVFYDLETTSLYNARIIEIAAYNINNNSYFYELVYPECVIPPESIRIHHITNEKVRNCKTIDKILPGFITFCGSNCTLIAHNNDSFDKLVLQDEFNRSNIQLPNWKYADTLKMARTLLPNLQNHKLDTLKEYYKINIGTAHNALDDVANMYEVYKLMKLNKTDDEMIQISNEYKINYIPFGKYKGTELKKLPKDYVKWLIDNLDKKRNKDLLESLHLFKDVVSI